MNELELKYGCNPNQKPARVFMKDGSDLPFTVLNGKPGYINLLDAFNSFQLVRELKEATGLPAAASFKHVSPAGAALGLPLDEVDKKIYFVEPDAPLSSIACAYIRARGADRLCSYGDWAALSDECDAATAEYLKGEVSDGIIAPSFSEEALAILKTKKGGKYNIVQTLYEKKLSTYPRVDTQYLSDDIYPKCPSILAGLVGYDDVLEPLKGKNLKKSKKVFDTSKVTDHHAIIPTGVPARGLTDMERNVYNLIALRFISVFYPDCKFSTTTVLGKVEDVEFKVSGKEILSPGWRLVYMRNVDKDTVVSKPDTDEEDSKKGDEERTLPSFVKGESGPHTPTLTEKQTTPPKYYTEATLLRAMETAGKFVEDETLRAALKENGIGRPSSRAGIIETLFKRRYIRRERKNLVATATGIELIDTIHEELLKSCELTGIWEKKLRDIEHKKYDPAMFINELKQQITDIVNDVLRDNSNRHVTITTEEDLKKRPAKKTAAAKSAATRKKPTAKKQTDKAAPASTGASAAPASSAPVPSSAAPASSIPSAPDGALSPDPLVGQPCPVCGQGHIIKGKTAYGCSRWREGCTFRKAF